MPTCDTDRTHTVCWHHRRLMFRSVGDDSSYFSSSSRDIDSAAAPLLMLRNVGASCCSDEPRTGPLHRR